MGGLAERREEGCRSQPLSFFLFSQACARYASARAAAPPPPGTLFNWGVALTDLARLGDPPSRPARLRAAAARYEASLAGGGGASGSAPQALNNWGLVLHDLASTADPAARPHLLASSAARFRAALTARPDFDRGLYNLGTVLFGAARGDGAAGKGGGEAHAAAMVALAAATASGVAVYAKALDAVHRHLPVPFLMTGWLLAASGGGGAGETLSPAWCVLDAASLRSAPPPLDAPPPPADWPLADEGGRAHAHSLEVGCVARARRADDAALPAGGALRVDLLPASPAEGPTAVFYGAASAAAADAWGDCLSGAAAAARRPGGAAALAAALAPREGEAQQARRASGG